ncbi:MAG TPA: type II secretion pathway protein XcpS [Clostridiales bacterium]|nr:type II secretion pathway protein XcpS [Clostridiales bacterium]
MPIYKYTAKDILGKNLRGTLKAESSSELVTLLFDKQIFVTSVKEINTVSVNNRLTTKELAEFSREMGTMLSAGITLIRALGIIINRDSQPRLKKIFNDLFQSIKSGISFSDSLKGQGAAFPELFISMIYAGEASGNIDKTVLKMAGYYEKESRLNARIKSAMTYPTILAILTVFVVISIFTFIMPNFFTMFENMELPLPTRIVLAISNFTINYWYLLLGLVLFFVTIFTVMMQRSTVRLFIDKTKLRLPKIKVLLRIIYTARFARTMSTLYSSGLPLVSAIIAGQGTIGNRYIAAQFSDILNQVKSGIPLSKAITAVDGFDNKLSSIIMIGEETGQLGDMLNSVADSFDYESEIATQRLVTILEPLMIISMALIIGSIMISVLLPILKMYQNYS